MDSRNYSLTVSFVVFLVAFATAEDKWIWSKEHKTGLVQTDTAKISIAKPILNDLVAESSRRKIDDDTARFFSDNDYRKGRYEVQEIIDANTGRPFVSIKPRPFVQRPIPNRPLTSIQPLPAGTFPPFQNRDNDYNPLFAGNEQHPIRRQPAPPQSVGILTGPVPSWEKPTLHKNGDPTNFEHCKCSFSFNCKSPGIQFGSCDQGKTYCCYNEFTADKDGAVAASNSGFGSAAVDRFDRLPSVLAGPGGPSKPNFNQRVSTPLLPGLSSGHVRDK
ncbi:hypothetical protein PGB90_004574 [Kerria lacca]